MNANELADALQETEPYYSTDYKLFDKAATMLRQLQADYYSLLVNHDKLYAKVLEQQAEIEALKKEAALQRLSDFTQEADNEPVAWRNLCVGNIGEDSEWIYNEIGQGEPLYTHPAKTLTDEEIWQITEDFWKRDWTTLDVGFARAILRKAQEK